MQTLFVDFDGTICHDKFWRGLGRDKAMLVQNTLFVDNPLLVVEWMCGKHSSEEVNKFISQKTGIKYQTLWDIFVNDCKTMTVEPKIFSIISKLRKKFHVVLITGNMDCFDRFTVPALKLDNHFDTIVNSYNEGQLKSANNGETFSKYGRGSLDNAYLVEDSSTSCKAFGKLGGTALHVTMRIPARNHLENLLYLHDGS